MLIISSSNLLLQIPPSLSEFGVFVGLDGSMTGTMDLTGSATVRLTLYSQLSLFLLRDPLTLVSLTYSASGFLVSTSLGLYFYVI